MLLAHPSADVYGSDLQLLQSIAALDKAGWGVHLVVPATGPLLDLVDDAEVHVVAFPVLRKMMLTPAALAGLVCRAPVELLRLVRVLRRLRPDVLYVNTVTIPWWLAAARLAAVPALVHVHEAEEGVPRLIRVGLNLPLLLADLVLANSQASKRAIVAAVPRLSERTTVVVNGIPDPGATPYEYAESGLLALVGRLSPRKGIDVALECLARLRAAGRNVRLVVCGTTFPGYEWYENELLIRTKEPDLAGAVSFLGYVHPTAPVLARAAVVLVPSRVEPFGNTVVEGMLAQRPVVASRVQGPAEIISDGATGVLVRPEDPEELARAVEMLLDQPVQARRIAERARAAAIRNYTPDLYRCRVADAVNALHDRPTKGRGMANLKSAELPRVAVRNGRRLIGRVQARRLDVDGVAPASVVKAVKTAALGRRTPEERAWIERIELMRALLLRSTTQLSLVDFGAGTNHRFDSGEQHTENIVVRSLGDMTKSSKPPRWGYLLLRLVRELRPQSVLELGACVGISASYQAAALKLNGRGRLVSLEGAEALATRSRHTLVDLELGDCAEVRLGRFADTLPKAIADLQPIGLAFIDGHHVESATLEYMEALLPALDGEAVLVFDDVNWSEGMRKAWDRIAADERFALTLTMRSVGIAVISASATTRHNSAIAYY